MTKKMGVLLGAAAFAGTAVPATAQDMLVLRRVIAEPIETSSPSPAPSPAPTTPAEPVYRWDRGEWSDWSSLCSDNATRTRAVSCLMDGSPTQDTQACIAATGENPGSSESGPVVVDCRYTPSYTDWGACTALPRGGGTQTRELTACTRSDGKDVTANYESYCKDVELEQSCTPQSPDEIVTNGDFDTGTEGWSLTDSSVWDCGTGSVGCYVTTQTPGSSLIYTTPFSTVEGATYNLSFSFGNLSNTGNFAQSEWKVESEGVMLLSGEISRSGRIGVVRSQGDFTGTGAPVTLTITRTRAAGQRIAYDRVSILKQ